MKIAESKVTYIDHMGTDLDVVNAARVSFNKESEWEETVPLDYLGEISAYKLSDKDSKLIRYLAKHKHFSPFNHTFISVRVKAPIFVARQLVKHEYMPWNEISRRYVDDPPEFSGLDFRLRADNVKQGSGEKLMGEDRHRAKQILYDITNRAEKAYEELKELGVCPEQCRAVLPHNLMTEWIWSGTLKAFAKMLQLRLDPHTQQETRKVAEDVMSVIMPLFPVSLPALLESEL